MTSEAILLEKQRNLDNITIPGLLRIPVEIHLMIYAELDQSTLCSLCLVNSNIRKVAQHVLHKDPGSRGVSNSTYCNYFSRYSFLIRTLLSRPDLAQIVRKLSISIPEGYFPFPESSEDSNFMLGKAREIIEECGYKTNFLHTFEFHPELMYRTEYKVAYSWAVVMFTLVPNLEYLILEDYEILSELPYLHSRRCYKSTVPPRVPVLKALKHLEYNSECFPWMWFTLPSLRSLKWVGAPINVPSTSRRIPGNFQWVDTPIDAQDIRCYVPESFQTHPSVSDQVTHITISCNEVPCTSINDWTVIPIQLASMIEQQRLRNLRTLTLSYGYLADCYIPSPRFYHRYFTFQDALQFLQTHLQGLHLDIHSSIVETPLVSMLSMMDLLSEGKDVPMAASSKLKELIVPQVVLYPEVRDPRFVTIFNQLEPASRGHTPLSARLPINLETLGVQHPDYRLMNYTDDFVAAAQAMKSLRNIRLYTELCPGTGFRAGLEHMLDDFICALTSAGLNVTIEDRGEGELLSNSDIPQN